MLGRHEATSAASADPVNGSRRSLFAIALVVASLTVLAVSRGAAAASHQNAAAPAAQTISGSQLGRLLEHQAVRLPTGALIEGDLKLSGTIAHPLICRECQFTGDLDADGATLAGGVDLSGSVFTGKVNLSGTTIDNQLIASGAVFHGIVDLRRTRVTGPTDFSESRFDRAVVGGSDPTKPLRRTTFDGTLDFSLATFGDLVSLENTNFERSTVFRLAQFSSDAVFAGGASASPMDFSRARFGGASDFSDFEFKGSSDFEGVQFRGPADFSRATFNGALTFDGAHFLDDATFLSISVPAMPANASIYDSFRHVAVVGDLTFAFATISRGIDFENASATGTMSFDDAQLAAPLSLVNISARDFRMPVGSVMTAVPDSLRRPILGLVESSATSRGDLATANDAKYLSNVLRSHGDSTPARMLDVVFYRWAAGYLVRPLHPLVALILLAAFLTLARSLSARREALRELAGARGSEGLPGVGTLGSFLVAAIALAQHNRGAAAAVGLQRALPKHVWNGGRRVGLAAADATFAVLGSLALIGPKGGQVEEGRGRQVEVLLYRVLFACVLIGLANSNPTLRQMFDALH